MGFGVRGEGKGIGWGPIAANELELRSTVQEMVLACDRPTIDDPEAQLVDGGNK